MYKLKQYIKNVLCRVLSTMLPSKVMRSKVFFHFWEAKGYHVTPVHYYEPVPDTNGFPKDIFERESTLVGIEMNETGQVSLLKEFYSTYREEYCKFPYGSSKYEEEFYFENKAFETVDAEILYCMVRHFKPKNIIEIGSGFSTRVTSMAIRQNIVKNPKYSCNFVCVEPYPKGYLSKIPEVTNIIQSRAEDLPIDSFQSLGENDILFIDSTHIINVYNDVCFEYLEVLPILNKGVFVHIHDILLPRIYCEQWYEQKFFWNEQYLLQAFLTFNRSFQILWAGNFMHLRYGHELSECFPSYLKFKNSKQGHKSFWMQRIQ